jgi:hypothetical protein
MQRGGSPCGRRGSTRRVEGILTSCAGRARFSSTRRARWRSRSCSSLEPLGRYAVGDLDRLLWEERASRSARSSTRRGLADRRRCRRLCARRNPAWPATTRRSSVTLATLKRTARRRRASSGPVRPSVGVDRLDARQERRSCSSFCGRRARCWWRLAGARSASGIWPSVSSRPHRRSRPRTLRSRTSSNASASSAR